MQVHPKHVLGFLLAGNGQQLRQPHHLLLDEQKVGLWFYLISYQENIQSCNVLGFGHTSIRSCVVATGGKLTRNFHKHTHEGRLCTVFCYFHKLWTISFQVRDGLGWLDFTRKYKADRKTFYSAPPIPHEINLLVDSFRSLIGRENTFMNMWKVKINQILMIWIFSGQWWAEREMIGIAAQYHAEERVSRG